jgi:nitroreductase
MTQVTLPHSKTTPDELLASLHWRYATKRFDPSYRIEPAKWKALEQTLVLAPSSYGLQPWHFLVVDDPELRKRLQAASWNQAQITEASHLVVFAIVKGLNRADVARYVDSIAAVRGAPRESLASYEKVMVAHVERLKPQEVDDWSRRQLYIALGSFLTGAALLGIDACPMEGIEPARYDELLGLAPRRLTAVCVATVGRRASDDKYASHPKVRFDAREVITHV